MTEAALTVDGMSPGQSPLVAVTFQRNVRRKEKFLEAEPKALGMTQIGLSVYQIICLSVFLAKDLSNSTTVILTFISSGLVATAGSIAIVAQNLNMKMLQACLGMQVVGCIASVFNAVLCLVSWDFVPLPCWYFYSENFTQHLGDICQAVETAQSHFYTESVVLHITLVAVSVTLAVYCCKVVNCCVPAPKVPVISVQAPPVQQ